MSYPINQSAFSIDYQFVIEACLFVCSDLVGWIPTKFGINHRLVPVSNLEILFWVDPPRGYNFGKTKKSKLSAYGPGRSVESVCGTFCGTFCATFVRREKKYSNSNLFFWGEIWILVGRAERGQSTGWSSNGFILYRAAKRPALS